ncbi:beta-ketoacyl-[acyl-carrier-protein] synthase family protein [Chitinophaga polysaccharea]|uniref:beta-ketoacyl-[acyl-carrier-protein] synthase family protein n=1 Tax=Chitinophaga polysaccharea TaxID=1293035 RepID=UPI001455D5AF|nr:beta-ketoacyl-[acyl-carrier-protein] synthase family protein [Chitinophaga polysaccharea]NLR58396.1 beta-ketoacyl-[acyl-carrier-protein] synthase family protein [Chitinophaga polysaccharea]
MHNRVVITGLGVVAPNGIGVAAFREAIKNGVSGIRYEEQLAALQFSCQIAGRPPLEEAMLHPYFDELELKQLKASGIIYGVMAGMQAWADAGLPLLQEVSPDWDSGTVFGTGTSGVDKFREAVYKLDELQVRRLGSTAVTQTMASGISAFLGGKLGLGNQVTTNSSACTTGAESLLMAYERIKYGHAKRMLAGSTSDSGPYIWGGFDAMKVSTFRHNDRPEAGSRPMSASASGIVPGSGAGALLLESLESALERKATIYAEVLGGNINSGGQRNGGSMTAPNSEAVQRCITDALIQAGVKAKAIDLINGHLTATGKDAEEVKNWSAALGRSGADFPYLNALKSQIGHCLGASGSIELVAVALQLKEGFIFPNINCEDLHPDILEWVDPERIPRQLLYKDLHLVAKASFGFGDVNACVILKKYPQL